MARQRNNIARLPAEIRLRICELLDDGATQDAIRADAQVAAACQAAGMDLHGSTFLAFQESAEFREFRERRRGWKGAGDGGPVRSGPRKQRNNIARLPADVRLRICELLDDGSTYEEVCADAQVAAACTAAGVTLHSGSFGSYLTSAEFAEFLERRRQWREDSERDRMAAAMISAEGGLRDMTDVAAYELVRKAMDQIKHGELGPRDLASLGRVLKDAVSREWQKERAMLLAKIAELSAEIAKLTGGKRTSGGLSDEAIEEIEHKARLL